MSGWFSLLCSFLTGGVCSKQCFVNKASINWQPLQNLQDKLCHFNAGNKIER